MVDVTKIFGCDDPWRREKCIYTIGKRRHKNALLDLLARARACLVANDRIMDPLAPAHARVLNISSATVDSRAVIAHLRLETLRQHVTSWRRSY